MPSSGEVMLARVQFTDTFEIKTRPVLVLFEEFGNIVVAGITSNPDMKGIPITKQEGAIKNSVIKLNYIFTISKELIFKSLFHLNSDKKRRVFTELTHKLKKFKQENVD